MVLFIKLINLPTLDNINAPNPLNELRRNPLKVALVSNAPKPFTSANTLPKPTVAAKNIPPIISKSFKNLSLNFFSASTLPSEFNCKNFYNILFITLLCSFSANNQSNTK